jgi:hypothetical protein
MAQQGIQAHEHENFLHNILWIIDSDLPYNSVLKSA